MRPLRLMRFLAVLIGLLSGAAYLWAPLVGPAAQHLRFAAPTLRWSVLPLRITAASPADRSALPRLPLRVEGNFLVSRRRHPEPSQVALHLPTPTPIAATETLPLKRPPRIAQIPDSRPTIAPAAPASPALPTVPEPAVRPATPTPTPTPSLPIPLPSAVQPAVPAIPPAPETVSPTPQPTAPATPPASANVPSPIQSVVPPTAPASGPVPTPVSEPPPPPTPAPTPTPIPSSPAPPPAPVLQTRPGRGCGDHNHVHTGPPGNPDATPC